MPTRISASVGALLFFTTMIPIDCKITNFPLYSLLLNDRKTHVHA